MPTISSRDKTVLNEETASFAWFGSSRVPTNCPCDQNFRDPQTEPIFPRLGMNDSQRLGEETLEAKEGWCILFSKDLKGAGIASKGDWLQSNSVFCISSCCRRTKCSLDVSSGGVPTSSSCVFAQQMSHSPLKAGCRGVVEPWET